jgi:hypothetical protein
MNKKYIVRLTDEERDELAAVIKKLKGTSQKVRRAQILAKADADGPNWTDHRIAEAFGCRTKTVENVRQRLVERGFRGANRMSCRMIPRVEPERPPMPRLDRAALGQDSRLVRIGREQLADGVGGQHVHGTVADREVRAQIDLPTNCRRAAGKFIHCSIVAARPPREVGCRAFSAQGWRAYAGSISRKCSMVILTRMPCLRAKASMASMRRARSGSYRPAVSCSTS